MTVIILETTLPRTLNEWVAELLAHRPHGRVEGWLFEGVDARRDAEKRLADQGIHARFYSAYKPLVFHFLEQVETAGLERVTVHYPVHPKAAPRRFSLEAYPLADMLEGIELQLLPQPLPTEKPIYEVELWWRDGRHRTDHVFAPNHLHRDPLGEVLLSPTAWLADLPRDSDYQAVFRHAVDAVMHHPWPVQEPYFERLELRVDIPAFIQHHPAQETGWIDSLEALHEDLYFSLLEIFQRRSGRPVGDRRLQPGQIVPDVRHAGDGAGAGSVVRLRIASVPYPVVEPLLAADDGTALADAAGPLPAERVAFAVAQIEGERFEAFSRQGRAVLGVYRAGPGPAVLISGGQHANEASGVVGVLRAAEVLAARPDSHFALIALENPDGYALHRELCAVSPRHMAHAARYTALGDDLEFRETEPFYERAARLKALSLSGALLHVNLHGYPAHEWTRPLSGYIPRGFDLWTVPKGFFLIVRFHSGFGEMARVLVERVCWALAAVPGLAEFNARQRAGYLLHAGSFGFEVIHGTACSVSEVNREGSAPITFITEYPDETVYGAEFLLAHEVQMATVLAAVDCFLSVSAGVSFDGL